MKNNHAVTMVAVLAALCISISSCVTQDKCFRKFPPKEFDSSNYREVVRDTFRIVEEDSSMSQYLIECQKEGEGYKARIVQLLTQRQGSYIQTPAATINNNVLTTTARTPEREIHYQVKTFYYSAVKAKVFVKYTNILTGWQWLQVWLGRIFIGILILIIGYIAVRVIVRFKSVRL